MNGVFKSVPVPEIYSLIILPFEFANQREALVKYLPLLYDTVLDKSKLIFLCTVALLTKIVFWSATAKAAFTVISSVVEPEPEPEP